MATTDKVIMRMHIDKNKKTKAQKILKRYGLTVSTAVKIFLAKVEETNRVPFSTQGMKKSRRN